MVDVATTIRLSELVALDCALELRIDEFGVRSEVYARVREAEESMDIEPSIVEDIVPHESFTQEVLPREARFEDLEGAIRSFHVALAEAVARCEKAAGGQNATADYQQFIAPIRAATAKVRLLASRFPSLRDTR